MFKILEELDFTNDIALRSSKQDNMQEKTNRTKIERKQDARYATFNHNIKLKD